jgi:tRNA 2-thiouridine synthesizing protein D
MNYAIQVNGSPYATNAGLTAFRFVEAAISMGHTVSRVFFYHDGVFFAFNTVSPPDDELNLTLKWHKLADRHTIDLVVCISAAQRRGLLSNDENTRRGRVDDNLAEGFRISGLGQLLEAMLEADRFIIFG